MVDGLCLFDMNLLVIITIFRMESEMHQYSLRAFFLFSFVMGQNTLGTVASRIYLVLQKLEKCKLWEALIAAT